MGHEYERHEGLSRVTSNPEKTLINVVFVHGLGGGAHSTWNSGESTELGFWPKALAMERPQCCVWTVHYTARILERTLFVRSRTIDLMDRASWLVESLVSQGIQEKPIVFVAHSLGGVLVKQALQFAHSLGAPAWRALYEQTRAIFFLATPHDGAKLADFAMELQSAARKASLVGRLFFRPSPALRNLRRQNAVLRYLKDWYRDQVDSQGITTCAFAESLPYMGVVVVDASCANPGVAHCPTVPVPEADHISIAKPAAKTHLVYQSLNKYLAEQEKQMHASGATPVRPLAPMDKAAKASWADNRRFVEALVGFWWERITSGDASSAISFVTLEAEIGTNSIHLSGDAYNKGGDPTAHWKSIASCIRNGGKNEKTVYYFWAGKFQQGETQSYEGVGEIRFRVSNTGQIDEARGDFSNINFETQIAERKYFELRRCSDTEIQVMTKPENKGKRPGLIRDKVEKWRSG